MNELAQRFQGFLGTGEQVVVGIIDVLLVTFLVYRLLKLIRGTRAWRVVLGIAVFIVALFLSEFFELNTLHWVLEKAALLAPVALAILFLPEVRQAIEGFAKLGSWSERFISPEEVMKGDELEVVIAAVAEMAEQRTGALLVLERGTRLDDIAENGVPVNAQVTAPLLGAIFNEGSPLHDGAVLIRAGTVVAAACRLPLSESSAIDPHFHMRHRAGVGISEQSDCVVIIVSEERGLVHAAIAGKLTNVSGGKDLRDLLNNELRGGLGRPKSRRRRSRGVRPAERMG